MQTIVLAGAGEVSGGCGGVYKGSGEFLICYILFYLNF